MSSSVFDRALTIADAVLYEGYVLYPYRASAGKNQVRWQFGVLAPRAYSEAGGSDPWAMQTDVVVDPGDHPTASIRLRCLQVQSRTVEEATGDGGFRPVDRLEVDGALHTSWDEAVEQEIDLGPIVLDPLRPGWSARRSTPFELPTGLDVQELAGPAGEVVGRIVRERRPVRADADVDTEWVDGPTPLVRLRVRIENREAWNVPDAPRDEVVLHSLVAVHTLLAVTGGRFVSLMDPPEFARPVTDTCENVGTFPVLADGDTVVLSSPIILYDNPEVAPESPGALFDSTEIDEILALRILTLTDDEKREARAADARVAEIVDRVDAMPPEIFDRLHGAVRYLEGAPSVPSPPDTGLPGGLEAESELAPWWDPGSDATFDPGTDTVWIAGTEVGAGAKVVLRPRPGADAHDMFLAGRTATVQAVLHDVDGEVHVAVVVDDDPGAEVFAWQGRFNYFRPDEVEPAPAAERPRTLVAGIGNIFLGDDGFGVEVAQRLEGVPMPAGVEVADVGIRGVHLAYQLLEGYDLLVLVDALPRGEPPGTVTVLEPAVDELTGEAMDAHTMDPGTVLATLRSLGGSVGRVLIVGCEPEGVEEGIGLSAPVEAAVDAAVRTVIDLVTPAQVAPQHQEA